ncbi:MAG: hypothetical protein GX101_01115 [Firmicutes bacterium]|jgi:electron transport complex protein RnfA|nr:Rnf-Nqr domain containing protein [Bacillota bacterium]NLO65271.1 hypothetical protein [Bacillota bacterium]
MINGLDFLAETLVANNLILVQGLGLYAMLRRTNSVKEAFQAGYTTLFGMLIGGALLWLLAGYTFASLSVEIGFYLIVGAVASVFAHGILRQESSWEDRFADSALVGLLLLLGARGAEGAANVLLAFGGGLGYGLVLLVMAVLRQRLELAPIPKALKGAPILLITAGLLGIALLGFRF